MDSSMVSVSPDVDDREGAVALSLEDAIQ